MTWQAPADPSRFEDAIAWFRERVPELADLLAELEPWARRRAFWVSGVAELDVVTAVLAILTKLTVQGGSLIDFKREAKDLLTTAWGRENGFRIETIYRTNTQTAYGRGRWKELERPEIKRFRPYRMHDGVLDSRQSEICKARSSPPVVLPADDPYWLSNWPPLHHRCRSSVRALTKRQGERRGVTETTATLGQPPGDFGSLPTNDEWQPDLTTYPPDLRAAFEDKQRERERDDE